MDLVTAQAPVTGLSPSASTKTTQSAPTQAASPLRPQTQVLIILDQVHHSLIGIKPNCSIVPLDATDTTLVAILTLVVIAAVRVAGEQTAILDTDVGMSVGQLVINTCGAFV